MKTTLLIAALFLSIGAYAQTSTPTRTKPEMHRSHRTMTPEQRAEFKAEQKAKLAAMSPAERKALKAQHKRKREERLANMTTEQRQKVMTRKQTRTVKRRQNG